MVDVDGAGGGDAVVVGPGASVERDVDGRGDEQAVVPAAMAVAASRTAGVRGERLVMGSTL